MIGGHIDLTGEEFMKVMYVCLVRSFVMWLLEGVW